MSMRAAPMADYLGQLPGFPSGLESAIRVVTIWGRTMAFLCKGLSVLRFGMMILLALLLPRLLGVAITVVVKLLFMFLGTTLKETLHQLSFGIGDGAAALLASLAALENQILVEIELLVPDWVAGFGAEQVVHENGEQQSAAVPSMRKHVPQFTPHPPQSPSRTLHSLLGFFFIRECVKYFRAP